MNMRRLRYWLRNPKPYTVRWIRAGERRRLFWRGQTIATSRRLVGSS